MKGRYISPLYIIMQLSSIALHTYLLTHYLDSTINICYTLLHIYNPSIVISFSDAFETELQTLLNLL